MPDILIARDPIPGSRLPYLLLLPVAGEAPLVLACAAIWPGAKDVFCHPLPSWPPDAQLLETLPVEQCWRVGKAVHLVLQRRQRRRSLFVWTVKGERQLIFWRSQRSMGAARPGMKVPAARGLDGPLEIAVDVRERYGWRFGGLQATLVKRELPVGDYGIFLDGRLVAAVERKTPADLAGSAIAGTLAFALAELEALALATGGRDWTSPTYAAHFSISQATAWQDLTALVEAGALKAEGERRGRRYRRVGEGESGGDSGG